MARPRHTPQFRGGSGEPLLLLNGGVNTWTSWEPVLPHLTPHFDVLAPSHAGNAGGPPLPPGPITSDTFTDAAQAAMDGAGWETAHVAGYSAGGLVAMELGRRGRARSIWSFAPAGGWPDPRSLRRVQTFFRLARVQVVLGRPFVPWATAPGWIRKLLLRGTNLHGDRMPQPAFNRLAHELRDQDWRIIDALVDIVVKPYPDPGVPVTLSWSPKDRLLPAPRYSDPWRAAAPHAEWREVRGVGHMPTFDDPELVAAEIMRTVARAS